MNRCKVCGGKLRNDKVSYRAHWRDRTIGVEGISALVCNTCGRTYIKKRTASSLKALDRPMEREEFLKNPVAFMEKQNNFSGEGDRL